MAATATPPPTRRDSGTSKSDLFDVIVETASSGIIVCDKDGGIVSFGRAAERMFGFSEPNILGQNVSILMPEFHAARHDEYMQRYLETGEKRIIGLGRNVIAKRGDGSEFAAHLEIGELKRDDDSLFVAFISDRSAEKAATDKARRLQQQLERLGREQLVGEMSTVLAHELNQPLTAISNFARAASLVLEQADGDRAKAQTYLDRVVEQSLRSGEIVKRMRGLMERGQVNLRPEDINQVVEEAVRASETNITDTPIEVHLALGQDLPPVLADRIQIQQVVVNLLRNAREAMESAGKLTPEIATEMLTASDRIEMKARLNEDKFVVVTISDTGPGVPPEMLSAIFDPLVTTKPNGFGVGLAICRSIINAHGGQIWAENNPNGGANVHFSLRTTESP